MGEMIGASPAELRKLATGMKTAADRLEQIRNDLSTSFHRTHWEGGDGEDIRADWMFRYSGMVHVAANAMQTACISLERNADQQEQTSGSEGDKPESPIWRVLHDADNGLHVIDFLMKPRNDIEHLSQFLNRDNELAYRLNLVLHDDNAVSKFVNGKWEFLERVSDSPWTRALYADRVAYDASDALKFAGHVGVGLKYGLPLAGAAIGTAEFLHHPTARGGVDAAFQIAEAATIEFPPASIALAGAQAVTDFLWDHRELRDDIGAGVTTVASDLWSGNGRALTDGAHAVEKVGGDLVNIGVASVRSDVKAVGNVISGGVKAVSGWF